VKIQAWRKSCGNSAVSRTKGVLLSNKIHTSTYIYLCHRRRMGVDLQWSRLRTFSMRTSSMSSLIGKVWFIFGPISTRDVLVTSGAQMVPSFSRVSTFCIWFSLFFHVYDILPDLSGRLVGETIIKASLKTKHWQFCTQPLVSATPILNTVANGRRCLPILTLECPCENWIRQTDGLPGSDDTILIVCAGRVTPDSSVRCHGYHLLDAGILC